MDDYPGAMAVLIESLKGKGVRFDESDFKDGDIIHENQYVTIIRGEAGEFLHRIYESLESGATAEQATQYARLLLSGSDFRLRQETEATERAIFHRNLPNEKGERRG